MDRREFTKKCFSCLAVAGVLPLTSSCQSTYYTSGTMESNGVSVSKLAFKYMKKGQELTRSYIVVRNDALQLPIYLYRFSDSEYAALLMKCTHQGNELSVSGDHLTCSAHGSEFTNKGNVVQGPAEKNLRSFTVQCVGEKIFIDLRA